MQARNVKGKKFFIHIKRQCHGPGVFQKKGLALVLKISCLWKASIFYARVPMSSKVFQKCNLLFLRWKPNDS
ncbi:unnamed protein product [Cuscuta campestris]|uniref:Uncharacterized protein n=1 Tax=Cuscuta campestris TaxID=132261 RepID=A0A484M9N5_9ASTE|nr:unnamed protein product [Cuscuta campestris]